jgi:hypothetical protein
MISDLSFGLPPFGRVPSVGFSYVGRLDRPKSAIRNPKSKLSLPTGNLIYGGTLIFQRQP